MKSEVDPQDILRGIGPLILIILNLSLWIFPLVALALLKLLIPLFSIKKVIYRMMLGIYSIAVKTDNFILHHVLRIRFEVDSLEYLGKEKNCLILTNHQSWADILVLQGILIGRTPIIKFIVKQELLYLPLIGLICWAYEYPFVHRSSFKKKSRNENKLGSDLQALSKKLAVMKENPATIINFAEGTRFNNEKQKKYNSPYQHLLKPRSGGVHFILNTFGEKIDFLIDITIAYDCSQPIFFKFLGGRCREVKIQARYIAMDDLLPSLAGSKDNLAFEKVDAWLKNLWAAKDRDLSSMQEND
jgi:1-acyl-sn-glycerol-3-phosphate acyltransferase